MARWQHVVGALAAALALAFVPRGGSGIARSEDTPPGAVHVRGCADVGAVAAWLEAEAARIHAAQALVVLDAITFRPPPGRSEFTAGGDLSGDLDAWLHAAERLAAGGLPVRATTSWNPMSVRVGPAGWREEVRSLAGRAWWEDGGPPQFEPAASWMQRLLERTEDGVPGSSPPQARMLVLVAGRVTPERWVPPGSDRTPDAAWRLKLLPVGTYWDGGRIAALLAPAGCRLYVVSPEAWFGDVEPFDPLPALPWTSRPMRLPGDFDGTLVRGLGGSPYGTGVPDTWGDSLDRALRAQYPDPIERRRRVEEIRRMFGLALPRVPFPGTRTATSHDGRWRFAAALPSYFAAYGEVTPWVAHVPSGYGWAPYARAAAATGGRYVFYPPPAGPWLDRCPADEALLDRLAPPLDREQENPLVRAGDPALDAVCRAVERVADVTPSTGAAPWAAFGRGRPPRPATDFEPRRRPTEADVPPGEAERRRMAEDLRRRVLPRYDEALRLLEKAIAAVDAGEDALSPPRSVADLRYARFSFALSTFHLEAWRLALSRTPTVPVLTIRLSDCLEAYDGRTIAPADEAAYPRWNPAGMVAHQGNLFDLPAESPDVRAKRPLDRVLLHLDPRLRARAIEMVLAAEHVRRHLARTGWGWATYYAEAFTFEGA